ncbi:MAG TPA: ABC transporter permease [Nannocystaceae bacterium]|nr:ABC transporter permease [Nannocystaceae bacterium]
MKFRHPLQRSQAWALQVAALASLLLAWFALRGTEAAPIELIPGPGRVLQTGVEMVQTGFLGDVWASTARILVAFLASAVLAVPIGIGMSSFKAIESLLAPVIEFIRYIPVPALLPLFVLASGIGEEPKFLVLFVGTFFQLVLLIKDDVDQVPQSQVELAQTMGATIPQIIRDVLVPASLPRMYDNLRVTLGWCWTYLVIAELIAADRGVGHILKEAQRFNATDRLVVCVATLGVIGLLTDYVARWGYRAFFPYVQRNRLGER